MSGKIKIVLLLFVISSLTYGYFSNSARIEPTSPYSKELAIKDEKIKKLENEINNLQTKNTVNYLLEALKNKQDQKYKSPDYSSKNTSKTSQKLSQHKNNYTYVSDNTYTYKPHKLKLNTNFTYYPSKTFKYPLTKSNTESEYFNSNKLISSSNYSKSNSTSYSSGYTNPNHE